MQKLLIISYSFPPLHDPESTQILNLTKYFPQFGWTPIIMCGKPSVMDMVDQESLRNIDKSIRIYRTNSFENLLVNFLAKNKMSSISRMNKIAKRKKGNSTYNSQNRMTPFFKKLKPLTNRKMGWLPFSILTAMRVVKKENIKIIFSRSGAINSHLIALIIKSFTGIHWIASFSDPWTTDPNLPYKNRLLPEKLIRGYDELIEHLVISNADKIVFTTDRLKSEYKQRFEYIKRDKFIVIPNCSEPMKKPRFNSDNDENHPFTLTYAGSFLNQRSPEPLFKALNLLKKESDVYRNIRIQLIGTIGGFESLISKYRLTDIVQIIGIIPHKEIFPYLYRSDVLLLIDAPNHTMCLASKLVEYLFIGKPILAITSEEGCAADVVKATKTGIVISPYDVEGIKDAINNLFNDYLNGNLTFNPNYVEINKYTAKQCSLNFIQVIEKMVD